jgi:hypothetical protein
MPGLIKALEQFGVVGLKRVYGNATAIEKWRMCAIEFGIQPMLQFNPMGKENASDFALTIDAMDLLHGGGFSAFCIVSSDSDFVPLATRIRAAGLPVYGCGEAKKTVASRAAYTDFIAVESLLTPKPGPAVPEPVAKTAPKLGPAAKAKPTPKEKSPSKAATAPAKREPTKETLQKIRQVIESAGGGTQKVTTESLGQRLKKEFPTFSCKDYQRATLGKFLSAYPDHFDFSEPDDSGKSHVKLR